MPKFGFVVDTNKYSGNFERELCAYMTGHIGECGVGDDEQDEYKEAGFKPLEGVRQVADDHGCHRPVQIYPTLGIWNNGMGFHYKEGEEELALQKWIESMVNYKTKYMNMYKSYYDTLPHDWTVEKLDKVIAEYEREIEKAKQKTEVGKYPAYESIIIYFNRKPTQEMIDFMKQRANEFVASGREKGLEITGFRLVMEESKEIYLSV